MFDKVSMNYSEAKSASAFYVKSFKCLYGLLGKLMSQNEG